MATTGTKGELRELHHSEAAPWPGVNPRRRFPEEKIAELAGSIEENGVLENLVAHDRGDGVPDGEPRYWIIAGESRWRACVRIDASFPARIGRFTKAQAIKLALIENMHRNELTPIEEARGFQAALDEDPKLTQKQLAEEVKRSPEHVSNRLRLLRLPDIALTLLEDGVVETSAARDFLVPFAGIPEAVREKFYKAVAKALRNEAKNAGDMHASKVRDIVGRTAVKFSRPLYRDEMVWGHDQNAPVFDAKLHKKCRCQGPRFNYRGWAGTDHARCFDGAWWEAAQEAALAEQEKEAEAAAAEMSGDDQRVRVMTREQFQSKYGWGHYELDPQFGRYGEYCIDATQLADAPLVVVTRQPGEQPSVHCVDEAAVKRAKAAVTRERNQMLAERKAERGREDLARVADMDLEPWMLSEILTARPYGDAMMFVGRELGFDMGKHGEIDAAIRQLPADQLQSLFKVLALRSKEKRLTFFRYSRDGGDPIEREVDGILKRKYGPGVRALIKRATASADAVEPAA